MSVSAPFIRSANRRRSCSRSGLMLSGVVAVRFLPVAPLPIGGYPDDRGVRRKARGRSGDDGGVASRRRWSGGWARSRG